MDAHRADRGGAATAGRGPGTPKTTNAAPLPLAARRVLWDRTWVRLLAVPPAEPDPTPRGKPGEGDPGPIASAEGGVR